jgi:uncharacterized membrane protein (UPF0127 family)
MMRYVYLPVNAMKTLFLISLLALGSAPLHAQTALPEITLTIKGHKLTAEVAANDNARTTGLMHRRMMPENRGMLFVFAYTQPQSFWMMNTYLPLSIAFIDEQGVIINIDDMKPLTTDPHPSTKPAKYALEMNQGWFAKRGIKAGAHIDGLKDVTPRGD